MSGARLRGIPRPSHIFPQTTMRSTTRMLVTSKLLNHPRQLRKTPMEKSLVRVVARGLKRKIPAAASKSRNHSILHGLESRPNQW